MIRANEVTPGCLLRYDDENEKPSYHIVTDKYLENIGIVVSVEPPIKVKHYRKEKKEYSHEWKYRFYISDKYLSSKIIVEERIEK